VQAINLRGLRDVRTAMKTGQRSRSRSQDGVLSELAHLEREKVRLKLEKGNWDNRLRLIEDRLAEIAQIEKSLGLADGALDSRAAQRRRAERFDKLTVVRY